MVINKRIKVLSLLIICLFGLFVFDQEAHAAAYETSGIMKKWVFTLYYGCTKESTDGGQINDTIETKTDGKVAEDVFWKETGYSTAELDEQYYRYLPSYGLGRTGSGSAVNCKDIFLGTAYSPLDGIGVLDYYHDGEYKNIKWNDSNGTEAGDFLKNIGYWPANSDSGENSYTITANVRHRQKVVLDNNPVSEEDEGTDSVTWVIHGDGVITETSSYSDLGIIIKVEGDTIKVEPISPMYKVSEGSEEISIHITNDNLFNALKELQSEQITVESTSSTTSTTIVDKWTYEFDDPPTETSSISTASYEYAGIGQGADRWLQTSTAIKRMSGQNLLEQELNDNERYTLYYHYLDNAASQPANNGLKITCDSENATTGYWEVTLKDGDGVFKTCYVHFDGSPEAINVYTQHSDSPGHPVIIEITMQDVIDWFNTVDASKLDPDAIPSVGDTEAGAVVDDSIGCEGADIGFAYIVCPLIETISSVAEGIYSTFVEPSLRVEPMLFTGAEGSAKLSYAWGIFRDLANIIFAIVLLVVIFSQLTGYGITNYGIKKLLPKLIIAVVLINLSYLVCVACVDLSNIFGNGLKALFDGIDLNAVPVVEGQTLDSASSAGIISIGILSGVVGVAALFLNPALIITLLVAALGVLISIFFMFVLLAIRQAAIIVLIVISPVIIVLYILPNTQKYFDKMFKLWGALLFLYPIMGLLIGGGNFVAKLLLSVGYGSSGTFQAFAAMIVGIIPIFMAPGLLNNALSGLNGLGAKISGIGKQFSRGTTGAIKSTSGYKSLQQAGSARSNRLMAGLDKNGRPNAFGNLLGKVAGSKFGGLGYSRLYRSRINAARKDEAEQREAMTTAGEVQREYADSKNPQTDEDYFRDQLMKVSDSKDDNKKLAVLAQMDKSNLQNSKKAELFREIFGTKPQDAIFLRKVAQTYGGGFLTKDYEALDWARKGGLSGNESVALGGAGAWASDNMKIDDMKDENVAALSSGNLAAMIKAGKVSQAQAQRVWASNSNMDDTNRLIMGAYGNSGIMLNKQEAQAMLNPKSTFVGPSQLSPEQIEAYTERSPEDVRLRDVDIRNKEGAQQQTDELIVSHNKPSNGAQGTQSSQAPTPPLTNSTASSSSSPIILGATDVDLRQDQRNFKNNNPGFKG